MSEFVDIPSGTFSSSTASIRRNWSSLNKKGMAFSHICGIYYRPQRSCSKVIFWQVSVILSTGGVSAPVHAGIHPPGRHPRADTPGRHPPPDGYCTYGTHPTGMLSCLLWFRILSSKMHFAMRNCSKQFCPVNCHGISFDQ